MIIDIYLKQFRVKSFSISCFKQTWIVSTSDENKIINNIDNYNLKQLHVKNYISFF